MLFSLFAEQVDLKKVVGEIRQHLALSPLLLLKGNLGSGKTTLCKLLLSELGVESEINSPTFNIVNTYKNKQNQSFFHFDLYRIKHLEELDEIGFYEYLDSGHLCLIEWPEIIETQMDMPYLELAIEQKDNGRQYTLKLKS